MRCSSSRWARGAAAWAATTWPLRLQPATPEDFPEPAGRSIAELRDKLGGGGPRLVPAVSQFEPGSNRFGFGLFDRARSQIADAPVGIYVAPEGGGPAHGPFVARYESLEVKPQFQSRSVASDPDAARSLYVARLDLPKAGRYDDPRRGAPG